MTDLIKVLYVDDEENNLVAFRANFRKIYDVYTADSAKKALEILKETHIQILISDQRMPDITGVEFLEQTVELYPESIRLLITGQADIEVVIEAINRGQVSKYIQKPWDWDKLSIAIDYCVTLYTSRMEMKNKNSELKKVNEELNRFVYSVSHDLRSPLTSILGIINLTKLIPELKQADQYFEMIEGRVFKLDSLIKKIVDYYRNARSDEPKDNIDFKSLFLSVWDILKVHNNSIVFNLNVNQPTNFIGDLYRLEVVFENLISNAIKYQIPENQTKVITVNTEVVDEYVKIIISDNGIGIKSEYLESIYELFFRTENTLNVEGSGIGLYIVKEAIEKMQGKITIKSELMKGTSFEIIIPSKKQI
ncbi:MAG: hybrid sensor histidine kinase/response regulator [Bacteroidota bacterium]